MNTSLIAKLTVLSLLGVFVLVSAEAPSLYKARKGDTLSAIAKNGCGRASLYPMLKRVNNLKSDLIYEGQELLVPCLQVAETVTASANTEESASTVFNEIDKDSFNFVPRKEEAVVVKTAPVKTFVETPAATPVATEAVVSSRESVTVQAEWPPKESSKKNTLKEGLYAFTFEGDGYPVGTHPVVILVKRDSSGRWEEKKAEASVNRTANGHTQVLLQMRDNLEFSEESSVMIHYGGNKITQLLKEDFLPENRVRSTKGLKRAKLSDERYQVLLDMFPKKPGVGEKIARVARNDVLPGGLAIASGNPVAMGTVGFNYLSRAWKTITNRAKEKAFNLIQEQTQNQGTEE